MMDLFQADDIDSSIELIRKADLSLDMTRGKPDAEQLALSNGLMSILDEHDYLSQNNIDCRNYGCLDGLPEAKALFADYLEIEPSEIFIGGNSSLNLMHTAMSLATTHGTLAGTTQGKPWHQDAKFLCPVPGYDRHFSICEHLGIEMLNVDMNEEGADMDAIEDIVSNDESVKGIWCVPRYSNPTGFCYTHDVIMRLAKMEAAKDFRIFWDDAYAVHHHGDGIEQISNILDACKRCGNPNRPYLFASTSKLTFPGAGVAMMGGSTDNMDYFRHHFGHVTVGFDKINQLRHVKFFKNKAGIIAHANKHADILRDKFQTVDKILIDRLQDHQQEQHIAHWSLPKGGYFISVDVLPGCAKKIIALAASLGLKLTPAGSTYPYGTDPQDCNIRLASTALSESDLVMACEILCVCIKKCTGLGMDE